MQTNQEITLNVKHAWWLRWLYLPGTTALLWLAKRINPHAHINRARFDFWVLRGLYLQRNQDLYKYNPTTNSFKKTVPPWIPPVNTGASIVRTLTHKPKTTAAQNTGSKPHNAKNN